MSQSKYYRVNADRIIFEIVEEQIMLIDLENGNYFCLENVAARVWQLMLEGFSEEEIVNKIISFTKEKTELVANEVREFLLALVNENILVESGIERIADREKATPMIGFKYQKPTLKKHTDMREFLLVDPVHEVNIKDLSEKK